MPWLALLGGLFRAIVAWTFVSLRRTHLKVTHRRVNHSDVVSVHAAQNHRPRGLDQRPEARDALAHEVQGIEALGNTLTAGFLGLNLVVKQRATHSDFFPNIVGGRVGVAVQEGNSLSIVSHCLGGGLEGVF